MTEENNKPCLICKDINLHQKTIREKREKNVIYEDFLVNITCGSCQTKHMVIHEVCGKCAACTYGVE